ncbi:unnamed protein product, partial [Cyprideis torosa]
GPWIGAIEVADTNDFIWYSNNSTVVIDNWATEQPNSPTFGDAAMMTCEFSFYWIGAEERGRDNSYEWASSGKPVFVTNWYNNYSPDSGTNDAILLDYSVKCKSTPCPSPSSVPFSHSLL